MQRPDAKEHRTSAVRSAPDSHFLETRQDIG